MLEYESSNAQALVNKSNAQAKKVQARAGLDNRAALIRAASNPLPINENEVESAYVGIKTTLRTTEKSRNFKKFQNYQIIPLFY